MIEVVIDSLRVSMMNYQRVVILKEKEGDIQQSQRREQASPHPRSYKKRSGGSV